jgi:hypothetical protein
MLPIAVSEPITEPPAERIHRGSPFCALSAYTLPSKEPM